MFVEFDLDAQPDAYRNKIAELENKITFSKVIFKGANGHVLIGNHNLLDREVVVKFYYWGNGNYVEPQKLASLEHRNILKVYDAESINDDHAYFITPFCNNGDLDDILLNTQLGPLEALDIVSEIASGVGYLHAEGYLHRDLKPQNIFIESDGAVMIGDFGSVVAQNSNGFAATGSVHSLIYRPPEDFSEQKFYRSGDVYQLGVLLYQLLGGRLPYNERDWLSKTEQKKYDCLSEPENQIYAQSRIENKIKSGRIFDWKTMPPWVNRQTKRILKRAVHTNRLKRPETCSIFITELNNLRKIIYDWRISDGWAVLKQGKTDYRIALSDPSLIQKKRTGSWKTDNTVGTNNLCDAIVKIEGRIS